MPYSRSVIAALSLFLAAAPLAAQLAPPSDAGAGRESATSLAPTSGTETVGVRMHVAGTTPGTVLPRRDRVNSPALMIVGGVGLLVGAVIGGKSGTIIMVGSAVIGLWGLYHYVK